MANPSPPQTGRGLGIKFNDMLLAGQGISHCAPGPTNSILDVDAVCVGHANYLSGNYYVNNVLTPTTVVPPADVNSGVTAILPLGNTKATARGRRPKSGSGYQYNTYVPAGFFSVNGCGEMTGIHWVEEYCLLQGPIMLCNTVNVGTVRSAVIKYWYDAQN